MSFDKIKEKRRNTKMDIEDVIGSELFTTTFIPKVDMYLSDTDKSNKFIKILDDYRSEPQSHNSTLERFNILVGGNRALVKEFERHLCIEKKTVRLKKKKKCLGNSIISNSSSKPIISRPPPLEKVLVPTISKKKNTTSDLCSSSVSCSPSSLNNRCEELKAGFNSSDLELDKVVMRLLNNKSYKLKYNQIAKTQTDLLLKWQSENYKTIVRLDDDLGPICQYNVRFAFMTCFDKSKASLAKFACCECNKKVRETIGYSLLECEHYMCNECILQVSNCHCCDKAIKNMVKLRNHRNFEEGTDGVKFCKGSLTIESNSNQVLITFNREDIKGKNQFKIEMERILGNRVIRNVDECVENEDIMIMASPRKTKWLKGKVLSIPAKTLISNETIFNSEQTVFIKEGDVRYEEEGIVYTRLFSLEK